MPHPHPPALTAQRSYPKAAALRFFGWLVIPVMLLTTPTVWSDPMSRFGSLLEAVQTARAPETRDEEVLATAPVVTAAPSYEVLLDSDIVYANGLSRNSSSTSAVEQSQFLDVYQPDNDSGNRPVFMFIHGGGFKGGTKTKPEIVEMADYFASRGWVFVSVDYRLQVTWGQ